MKYFLYLFFFWAVAISGSAQTQKRDTTQASISFYSLTIDSLGMGHTIELSRFRGKRVLVVPIASLDSNFSQIRELKKLANQNKDSLVIIACPTNDFNSEPASEKAVATFLDRFQIPFVVSAKVHVKGKDSHPLFKWLNNKELNGIADAQVAAPFIKYIIDADGNFEKVLQVSQRPFSDATVRALIKNTPNQ